MILFTDTTCPQEWNRDERYVWLIDLGDGVDIKRARQEIKTQLLAFLPEVAALRTSFSYTSHYMAMATSFMGALGVDIEDTRREFDFAAIAENFFTAHECETIRSADDFYQLWTAKEAFIKALGLGFAVDTQTFSLKRELGSFSKEGFTFTTIDAQPVCVSLCHYTCP